jgi:magnesium-transporting ATPase (P-type)
MAKLPASLRLYDETRVVAYEMLASKRPFEGASYSEVVDRIQNVEPTAVASFNPLVEEQFEQIVRRMLAKPLNARYAHASEIVMDLEEAMEQQGLNLQAKVTTAQGKEVVRCFVKGAPDVLISRATSFWSPDDGMASITDENRRLALDENDRLAGGGMRVMVVAGRDFDPATFDPNGNLIDLVQDLTLLAMVGIVDPPRPEAKAAIAECREAGIRVRMITGDHATTAAAIAGQLGIEGKAMTGAEFAAMPDEQLLAELAEIRGSLGASVPEAEELSLILDATERGVGHIVERARHT